ncbi:MAG: hypothetical protein HYV07_23610 [Deltaproteobacteria bacterium]|nr:hypothetical protein [Deltaproteobacteria bacterium]
MSCRACVAAIAGLLLASCAPKFEGSGKLHAGGDELHPSLCRVLVQATGIELSDDFGSKLKVTIPPARIEAFREITGPASISYDGRGGHSVAPSCGTLSLRGQGYHGGGRRAASGKLSLSCSGPPAVAGDFEFEGCF